jgi:hypothetical protein
LSTWLVALTAAPRSALPRSALPLTLALPLGLALTLTLTLTATRSAGFAAPAGRLPAPRRILGRLALPRCTWLLAWTA